MHDTFKKVPRMRSMGRSSQKTGEQRLPGPSCSPCLPGQLSLRHLLAGCDSVSKGQQLKAACELLGTYSKDRSCPRFGCSAVTSSCTQTCLGHSADQAEPV